MHIIKIPEGFEQPLLKGKQPINRRERFFEVVLVVIDNTPKLRPVEMNDLANLAREKFVPAREDPSIKEIRLKDSHYTRLKELIENFDGYIGIGAGDVYQAFADSPAVDETKLPQEDKPSI